MPQHIQIHMHTCRAPEQRVDLQVEGIRKSLTNHCLTTKLTEQRLFHPHTTKYTDFIELVWNALNKQTAVAATHEFPDFHSCHTVLS